MEVWENNCHIKVLGMYTTCKEKLRLMGAGYAILKWFADQMKFPKKFSEKAKLSGNY